MVATIASFKESEQIQENHGLNKSSWGKLTTISFSDLQKLQKKTFFRAK